MLAVQSNLAMTYCKLGRHEEALDLQREVYSVCSKVFGEHEHTLLAANNYASNLVTLKRFGEARSLMQKTMPVARRVLGDSHDYTLTMRKVYAESFCLDASATLDDLREAVTTFEDTARIARRVFGGAHPITVRNERSLRNARTVLRARETPSGSS